MPDTLLRRRKDQLYGVGGPANQYAFGSVEDVGFAMLYHEGTFHSVRATTEEVLPGSGSRCILTDPSEIVGPGSFLEGFTVWDVEGNAVYTYEPPMGWLTLGQAYYHDGLLYWLEITPIEETGTDAFSLRLRMSATDFSEVDTIETFDLDVADAIADAFPMHEVTYFMGGTEAGDVMVDDDGAVAYFRVRPQDDNGEMNDAWALQLRFELAGGAPPWRHWEAPETSSLSGAATVGGGAFRVALVPAGDLHPKVFSKDDEATDGFSELIGALAVGEESTGVRSFHAAPDGTTLQLFGSAVDGIDSERRFLVRGSGSWPSPTFVAPLSNPELPVLPDAMFFFGGV